MRSPTICVLLLALAAAAVGADSSVLQVLVGSDSDSRFQEILYLSTGVELNQVGLTTRRGRLSVTGTITALDRAAIAAEADRTGSDFVLVLDYRVGSETLSVVFSLYSTRARDGDLLATASLASPIDIDLDARIAEAVRELVHEAGVAGQRTAQTSIEGIDLGGPDENEPVRTVVPGLLPVRQVEGPEFAVLTSGVIVVGAASGYFRYGISGGLSGAYSPGPGRVGLSIGGRAGVMKLYPETGVVGGELYLLTVAPEVVIGTPTRAPARLGARVAGGAAVVIIARQDDTLAKTNLYMQGGMGARLPLGENLSIGIDVDYFVVFEPEFPIMGLVPSLTVSMEP